MTHLSPAEFVDLADGTLDPSRAAHADTCERCRAEAAGLTAMLRDAASLRGIDVPEPPPFFWDRFSARTRDAIAAIEPDTGSRRFDRRWVAAAAVVMLAVFAGTRLSWDHRPPSPRATAQAPSSSAPGGALAAQGFDEVLDSSNTEVWDVLITAASDMPFDEAHAAGMSPQAGAIDRAVQGMSGDELVALAQLLQSELKGAGD